MHWNEVAGYPMPKKFGGHPALDFCNTWAGWGEAPHPRREWLADYDRLAVWSGYAELIDDATVTTLRRRAASHEAEAAAILADAHDLRAALYRVLLEPADEAGFQHVGSQAARAAAVAVLANGPDGVANWHLPLAAAGLRLPVHAVAYAAASLLCTPDRNLVRACPGDDCGWLFLDRRGRRRWCSMAVCGNRTKVRRYLRSAAADSGFA